MDTRVAVISIIVEPVSYTHLDVYKRQPQLCPGVWHCTESPECGE